MPPPLLIPQSRITAPVQLIAEDLTVDRGSRRIITSLSFSVGTGEALVLTGANGAGKTTLLRTLAGFIRPFHGAIRLEGGDSELTLAEQAHIVGHPNAIKTGLTVSENVEFWMEYMDGHATGRRSIEAALRHFGLDELSDFPAAYLSAGQRRRLGLARLLVAERPVWLLDEPTASLDSASSERLVDAVNTHTSKGGIAVIATHLPLALERARALELAVQRIAA
jgi:heme exporter protein A